MESENTKKTYFKNKCKCKICGDIIESKSRHDYVECKCGACATDGGLAYTRRAWNPTFGGVDDVIENIVEEIKPKEYKKYGIKE